MAVYGGGGAAPQGQGYAMPPKVRFDTIGDAWRLFQQKMGVWIVAMLITIAVVYGIALVFGLLLSGLGLVTPTSTSGQTPEFGAGLLIGSLLYTVAIYGAMGVFAGGLMKMALKQIRGEDIAVGDLFSATDTIGPLIVALLLIGLGTGIGSYLCLIPGLILAGLWMLTAPIIVDQKVGAVDAMRMSWNALKGDILTATLFYFVLSLIASIGGLLCGVGALFTAPLLPLGLALTYRDFFGGNAGPGGPTLDMPLPPQSAYQPGQYPPPPSGPQG